MNVVYGAKSDVGRVREANEDSYLIADPLFVVADGMGGHIAGDVASSTAVKVIQDESGDASSENPGTLSKIISDANTAIWDKAQSDPALRGMGTTCTLVLVDEHRVHIAHVGDSRAYRLRDGQLEQLTEDHTLVGRMVQEGRLSPEEAQHHPQRSIITRALGVDEEVQVDLDTVELSEGDRLLICSDGLSSMVDDGPIKSVLASESDPQRAADRLIDVANEAGGDDNITVVVIDFENASGAARRIVPAAAPTEDEGSAQSVTDQAEESARPSTPTPMPEREEEPEPERPRRRWVGKLVIAFLVLLLLAGGAYAAARYTLSNSWYVGLAASGEVAIYSGIPDDIAGLELREVEETSSIALEDLPEFKRDDLRTGIKTESLEEARSTLANLEQMSQDFVEQNRTRDSKNNN
ncbi:MAG: Stp1/IreP family PP2C-type Ser/Thr phosphatase [Actinomycetota bacterium]|nr:Stp1/IreP family PP2C-type Ser/Thr phosphatase [Actinomycetota bacterium]